MLFLVLGIALVVMKYLEFGFVAQLSWFIVLAPFACAIVWWTWSDMSGRSKRIAMEKMEDRRKQRIQKHRDALKSGFKSRH